MIFKRWSLLIVYLLIAGSSFAQIDYDQIKPATRILFINNVHVMNEEKDSLTLYDLVIENGFISAMADTLERPAGARNMAWDSMYLYPSFIDAFSHVAVKKPEKEERSSGNRNEENISNGVTPENTVSEVIHPKDNDIRKFRKNGFAISHIAPTSGMLPGMGSVILLREEDLLLRKDFSLFMQFEGQRGIYPSTIIGIMAHWRDLYRSAGYHQLHLESYRQFPAGKERPQSEPSLEALFPVLSKEISVYHRAEKIKDVFRALTLQKELDYRAVLVNVKKAGPAIDKIQDQKIDLALSLDLPEEMKEKKESGKDTTEVVKSDPELENLKERKKKAIAEYEQQAAILEKAGVSFAFSMLDSDPSDVKENLLRMINAGLSKETALDALTIHAARLLKIDNIAGSIQKGKMANFFICDKPYFSPESRITAICIEGQWEEIPAKKKGKKDGDETGEDMISGRWKISVDIPEGKRDGTLNITKSGEDIQITVEDEATGGNVYTAKKVELSGHTLSFEIMIEEEGMVFPVAFSLNFEMDKITGTAIINGVDSYEVFGEKIDSPK